MRGGVSIGAVRVFLADFGLAKDCTTASRLTRTGATLGTPAYMSPELARGELAALTPASDVWALGCVLHEALAGAPAFGGDTAAAVVGAVLTTTPRLPAAVPRASRLLAAACLQRDPHRRPAAAGALRDECVRVLAGRLPATRPRRTAGRLVAAAALALTALASAWAMRGRAPDVAAGPPAEQLAERGWQLRHADPAGAEAALADACAREPGRAAWWLDLAVLRWARGDEGGALAALDRVPRDALEAGRADWLRGLLHLTRAIVFEVESDRLAALSTLDRAARTAGADAPVAAVALALVERRYDEARALGAPTEWSAALLRGLAESSALSHGLEADLRAGVAAYSVALEQGVPLAFAHNNRGEMRLQLGDRASALADFEAALRRLPGYAVALNNRGMLRHAAGDRDGACVDFDAALRSRPDYALALGNRGALRFEARDLAGAQADLDRAIALRPTDATPYYNRGLLRQHGQDWRGALADFDTSLTLRPHQADACFGRATMRQVLGDPAGARADYDEVLRLAPEHAGALNQRGSVRRDLGDEAGAEADFAAALAVDPTMEAAYMNRGELRRRGGRLAEALEDFATAMRLDPRDPAPHAGAGLAHQARAEWVEAMAAFERFLALSPPHHALRAPIAERLATCRAAATDQR